MEKLTLILNKICIIDFSKKTDIIFGFYRKKTLKQYTKHNISKGDQTDKIRPYNKGYLIFRKAKKTDKA